MRAGIIVSIVLACCCFAFAIGLVVKCTYPSITEERQAELISFAKNIAEEYQEKNITENEGFAVKAENRDIELTKENGSFVLSISFKDEETSKPVVISFPANFDDGNLIIGLEYPIFKEKYIDDMGVIFVMIMSIYIGVLFIFIAILLWLQSDD